MKAEIENKGIIEFTLASDGWYEYKPQIGNGLSINLSKTKCITDPWEADYICEAPTHNIIKILED
jgi:hypothetical protein